MDLVQNFTVTSQGPNVIGLSWDLPVGFNNNNENIIITKTSSYYPVELYNTDFPTKATDPIPVEIFRGTTIVGLTPGTVTVAGTVLTDTSANFSINPPLIGRLLRDSTGQVFSIISNTTTSVTLTGTSISGKYVILPNFPTNIITTQIFTQDPNNSTTSGSGYVSNLVQVINSTYTPQTFEPDALVNMFYRDGSNNLFTIKSNTETTIYFFESDTPVVGTYGAQTILVGNFINSSPILYYDTFKNSEEAVTRIGTGLLNNTFYYYTAFTLPIGANVAQVEFGEVNSNISTQASAISIKDTNFSSILYNTLWPSIYRELDDTQDLEYLMKVFGFQFDENHAYINTFNLQDADNINATVLVPMSTQTGLPSIGFSIGVDTLRRIARNMISCWKLKGTKEGIALYIRILTTWDITGGTADFVDAISDFLPNVEALRFFSSALGSTNVRISETSPTFLAGGRFAKALAGIVIPGFSTFREFTVTIPNVALFVGTTKAVSVSGNTTVITDTAVDFGTTNSLIGNFMLPNQGEINDIYEIVANTSSTITLKGIVNNQTAGGMYAILSPLNSNRFIILNKLMPLYQPFKTICGFQFT